MKGLEKEGGRQEPTTVGDRKIKINNNKKSGEVGEQKKSVCSPLCTQPGSLDSIGNPFYLMTGRQLGLPGEALRLIGLTTPLLRDRGMKMEGNVEENTY